MSSKELFLYFSERLAFLYEKNRKTIILLTKASVSVILIIYLLTKLDLSSLEKLNTTILIYLFFAFLISLAALFLMTVRWYFVLKLIDNKPYRFRDLLHYYLIGAFFSIFIPGALGGDAMRLYYVSKYYHLTKTESAISIIIERVSGLLVLAIILLFSLFFNPVIQSKLNFTNEMSIYLILLILLFIYIAKHFLKKKVLLTNSQIFIILFLSGLGQFGDILIAYILSMYFKLNLSILIFMSIMPLVYVATVVPISLGGVGVREGVMAAGLTLYGVSISDAVLLAFLLYITKIFLGILGWILYLRKK